MHRVLMLVAAAALVVPCEVGRTPASAPGASFAQRGRADALVRARPPGRARRVFAHLRLAGEGAGRGPGGPPYLRTLQGPSGTAQQPASAEALEHFYNLEYDQAVAEFSRVVEREPRSPEAHNHLAMAILYRAMLRAGALESEMVTGNNMFLRRPKVEATPEEQRLFQTEIAKAISLAQAALDRNPRDVQALYALGVAHGFISNYDFMVRKEWRSALNHANLARRYHNRVTELDPSFIDAKLVQGLHDYVVGSLPWHWRMLAFVVGFRGDKEKGVRTLETVAREGKLNRVDAQMLLCAVYRRERRPQAAIPLLQDLIRRYPRNYLLRMELAQMFSDAGDKDNALAALDALERAAVPGGSIGAGRVVPEKISYARGNIQFWYGDLDGALANMRVAAAGADRLDLNTGVLAWMRLGQIHDLRGEREQAREAYRRAEAFAPGSDAAKESRGYLAKPYTRRRRKS